MTGEITYGGGMVRYYGYPPDGSAYGSEGGVFIGGLDAPDAGPLPHHVKHSPTGFSWGYGGSGPADLARSLLIHALGDDARCKKCGGTGWVTEAPDGHEVPCEPGDEYGWGCVCERGLVVVPALYMDFKWEIIAKLPQGKPWMLTREEILQWVEQHQHKEANL